MLLLICLRDLPIYQEWDSGVLKRLTWFLQFSGLRSNYLQMFHKISRKTPVLESFSLHEKCPYSEFFWSVFSLNAVKYGPEKLPIRTLFSQCLWLISCHWSLSILRICRYSVRMIIQFWCFQGLWKEPSGLIWFKNLAGFENADLLKNLRCKCLSVNWNWIKHWRLKLQFCLNSDFGKLNRNLFFSSLWQRTISGLMFGFSKSFVETKILNRNSFHT